LLTTCGAGLASIRAGYLRSEALRRRLPDERHITSSPETSAIVDTDRVEASHLNVDLLAEVDPHDVGPHRATEPLSDAPGARRIQPNPFDEGVGNTQQTHVTYSSKIKGGAAAHD